MLRFLRRLFIVVCLVGGLGLAVSFLWTGAPFPWQATSAASAPSAKELETLWADLASDDAPVTYRALCRLAAHLQVAAPFLGRKLRPAEPVAPERAIPLLAQLDDDDFATRNKAQHALAGMGEVAAPALRQALAGSLSAEARRRAEEVLGQIERQELPAEDLRGVRAAEALERMGIDEARAVLAALAHGAEGATLTREATASLDRLTKQPFSNP